MIVSKFRSFRLRLKMYGFVVWQTRTWNEAQIIAILLEISARKFLFGAWKDPSWNVKRLGSVKMSHLPLISEACVSKNK